MAELTANEALHDALVRHQTYLLRYSGGVRNRLQALLDATEEDLAMRIRDKLRGVTGVTPGSVRRMQELFVMVDRQRGDVWADVQLQLHGELQALAVAEASATAGMIATVAPVVIETVLPASRQLRAIVDTVPFEGALLKQWAAGMAREDLRRIHAAIQVGMTEGLGSDAIARRVIGTGALNNKDGTLALTRRQVEAVTRTAVAHVAANARDLFIAENADIVLTEKFVATLDSRTTPVCKANDGKTFPIGKGPRPPLHVSCRSLRVPVLNGEVLSERPAVPVTQKQLLREFTEQNNLGKVHTREALPRGTKTAFDTYARKRKRELTGVVPASTSYQAWLTRQSRTFQEDTLGITKAKLFRDGKLPLDKFVAQDGTELTLDQLARRHATAFRAAGLDPRSFF